MYLKTITSYLKQFIGSFVAIAITGFALYYIDVIVGALNFMDNGHIATENTNYLHSAELAAGEILLLLNGIKSALAVLESSIAGISFIVEAKIQIGKAFYPLQETLGHASIASAFSLVSLTAIEILLGIVRIISVKLVSVTVIALGSHYIFKKHWTLLANVSGKIATLLVAITLMAHVTLPLTIYATHIFSRELSMPTAQETYYKLQETHSAISSSSSENQKIDNHVKLTVEHTYQVSKNIADKHHGLAQYVIKHLTYVLFETLILPLIVILLITIMGQIIIHHIIERPPLSSKQK